MLCAALFAGGTAAQDDPDNAVAVLEVQTTGVDDGLAPLLTEVLSTEVSQQENLDVIGSEDVKAMLGFEAQKQMVQCDDAECLAEIGGALGVGRIVVGHVGRLGEAYLVTIKLINIEQVKTERRTYEKVNGSQDVLIDTIKTSVTKLFGDKAPKDPPPHSLNLAAAPSKSGGGIGVAPLAGWGVGVVGLGLGAIFGVQASNQAGIANSREPGSQLAIGKAKSAQTMANVGYVLGGVGLAAGTALFFLSGSGDTAPEAVTVAPMIGPDGAGVSFALSF